MRPAPARAARGVTSAQGPTPARRGGWLGSGREERWSAPLRGPGEQEPAQAGRDPLRGVRGGGGEDGDRDRQDRLVPIPGTPPSLINVPPGCAFHPRCAYCPRNGDLSTTVVPLMHETSPGHSVACHYAEYAMGMAA